MSKNKHDLISYIETLILDYARHSEVPLTSKDIHNLARAAKELKMVQKITDGIPDGKKRKSKSLSATTLRLIEHDILGIKRD